MATNSEFWFNPKNTPKTIGDLVGREAVLNLVKEGSILDAGCGSGYMARKVGASHGCDFDLELIQKAKVMNDGICYAHAHMQDMPYEDKQFDIVLCVGALMYNTSQEVQQIFHEVKRVMRDEFVFSLTHPALYESEQSWVQFEKQEENSYKETYRNFKGEIFEVQVYRHTEEELQKMLETAGLHLVKTQSPYLTPEVLNKTGETGEYGPAFLQGVAR